MHGPAWLGRADVLSGSPARAGLRRKAACTDLLRPGSRANRPAVPGAAGQARDGGQRTDEIAAGVGSAYAKGELPKMETVAFAYMYSADMYLGPQVGHFHPHMMIYAPYYTNAMLGGNSRESMLPRTSDDEGTPFTVIVIPVDGRFAIKSKLPTK
jgi:hypothetical protein